MSDEQQVIVSPNMVYRGVDADYVLTADFERGEITMQIGDGEPIELSLRKARSLGTMLNVACSQYSEYVSVRRGESENS